MPKPNRRLAWIVLAVWAALGTVAGIEAGDAATHLTGQGGTSVHAEADVAGSMLQRAFPRPLSDVFAVTVQSPEPVTAPRPAAALDSLAVTLRRMPGARAVVTPQADTGGAASPWSAATLDASVVRVLLVPAIMDLAGRWNWWPGRRRAPAADAGAGAAVRAAEALPPVPKHNKKAARTPPKRDAGRPAH